MTPDHDRQREAPSRAPAAGPAGTPAGPASSGPLLVPVVPVSGDDPAFPPAPLAAEPPRKPTKEERKERERSARAERKEAEKAAEKGAEKPEAKDKKKVGRGVETMFRSAYRVNMDLSQLADTKANILMQVTGIMIPIILGAIGLKTGDSTVHIVPVIVLLLGVTGALVFAVLAARPRVEGRHVTLDEVRSGRENLLFFGNFAHMSRTEFVAGIDDLMDREESIYRNMALDLYGIGAVLQKKYRLLRVAYALFLAGVALGVLSYVAVVVIFGVPSGMPTQPLLPLTPAP